MSFRIAVDVGGTFSDIVITNEESGELWINKAATTPEDVFNGISEALTIEAAEHNLSLKDLLEATSIFTYGTTFSTNAILTGNTAKTAFVTTEGHPDTLVLREGGKRNPYDFREYYPEPYIPRRLTYEIRERISSEGEVIVPLDEAMMREIVSDLRLKKVQAVAVCLLWSIVNPTHEQRIGEILTAEIPDVPFTLSHVLNPIMREYRRASSTTIDASLKPMMQKHLRYMARDLRNAGFTGELLIGTSFGGVLTVDDIAARPIYSVNSAPAMAPTAGKTYAPTEKSILICDMGGTSFDVSLVRDNYIKFTRETWIGRQFTGHMIGLSAVDIKNIGAGGGSIAWIDPGGLLRVGPQSSGAIPGPACYSRGGTEPTVTDACVILGYIDPTYFLGGRISLSDSAARDAIETKIAKHLGVSVEDAAHAILTVANEHMVTAIRDITINEGLDPRVSLLIAGGGAGGMTIGRIAEELGCARVLVPRTAGGLSACGGLFSDIVSEFSVSQRTDTNNFDYEGINEALGSLSAQIEEFHKRLRTPPSQRASEFFVEARYPYQVWELEVPLMVDRFDNESHVQALVEAFHVVHDRVFGVSEQGQYIECIYWKARAIARLPKPAIGVAGRSSGESAGPVSRLQAWFGGSKAQQTARYFGSSLQAGECIAGPSIIQEPTTTIVVYPGWEVKVTESADYLMTRNGKDGAS
jgi:N-methylhydantoinase A